MIAIPQKAMKASLASQIVKMRFTQFSCSHQLNFVEPFGGMFSLQGVKLGHNFGSLSCSTFAIVVVLSVLLCVAAQECTSLSHIRASHKMLTS